MIIKKHTIVWCSRKKKLTKHTSTILNAYKINYETCKWLILRVDNIMYYKRDVLERKQTRSEHSLCFMLCKQTRIIHIESEIPLLAV